MKRRLFILLIPFVTAVIIFGYVKMNNSGTIALSEVPAEAKVYFNKDYKSPGCNVILISIDTLRADHLGCYDYPRNTTPNIDKFGADSVIFKEHIAQASNTENSHASLFTSLIPAHHGAFFGIRQPLREEIVTAAEILKDNGYKTVSYNGGGQISEKFGFAQGFDIYQSFREDRFVQEVDAAIEWLRNNPGEKFFFFLHTYEPHHTYSPQEEHLALFEKEYSGSLPADITKEILEQINKGKMKISAEDKQHIINTYDAELYSTDIAFGVLVDFLREEGLYDNTVIIFTSDHGEEFGEHGWWGWHAHTLYDELLKVPLIIKFQNSKYSLTVIEEQTSSVDVLPTLLDILDISGVENFDGVSLIHWFNQDRRSALFAISQQDTFEEYQPASIRTQQCKLYENRLYNLEVDPLEQRNVAKRNRRIVVKLRAELEKALNENKADIQSEKADLDEAALKRLKSLGYLK